MPANLQQYKQVWEVLEGALRKAQKELNSAEKRMDETQCNAYEFNVEHATAVAIYEMKKAQKDVAYKMATEYFNTYIVPFLE